MFNITSLLQPSTTYTDLEPQQALTSLSSYHLIDVREPHEFDGELGHIPGAELIPLASLPGAIARLRALGRPLLVICRSGGRSGRGAALLAQAGIERLYNLRGGMLQWNAERLPVCNSGDSGAEREASDWSLTAAGATSCC